MKAVKHVVRGPFDFKYIGIDPRIGGSSFVMLIVINDNPDRLEADIGFLGFEGRGAADWWRRAEGYHLIRFMNHIYLISNLFRNSFLDFIKFEK
tara:strand:- start:458 stop:739 length:282 start_codon:yes stop_codon:yes gene_type:complete